VIDPAAMRVTRRIVTATGPGMVVFRPDGKVAFVDHSFTPELDVVDVREHRVIERIPVISPFSPNLAATADGRQVWLTHKDVGKVTVVNAQTFRIEGVIETGPVTNHVNFAGVGGGTRVGGAAAGDLAYVTVGGENAVKVYTRDRRLVTTIPVGAVPHGLWPSGDGSKLYVGLQQGDAVAVIDTRTNRKTAEIPIGQSPQALVYVVNAVPAGSGTDNLAPLAAGVAPRNVELSPTAGGTARGTVTIRSLGPVDGVDLSVNGLAPTTEYTLFLSASGAMWPLATARTDSAGKANVEAVAPTTIPRGTAAPGDVMRRLVLVAGAAAGDAVVLEGRIGP
jgi:YVTN family beta-propeller protein